MGDTHQTPAPAGAALKPHPNVTQLRDLSGLGVQLPTKLGLNWGTKPTDAQIGEPVVAIESMLLQNWRGLARHKDDAKDDDC